MYIHSDKTSLFARKPLYALLLLILLGLTTRQVYAQPYPVRINMAVMPPYSTKISDYTTQPNKVYATLQYTSIGAKSVSIYLRGEISSSSGIRISTRPDYRPSRAIQLQAGSVYTLHLNNIQDVFDANQLNYAGISESEIIYGNGLPEDDYVICLRAYDYYTDQPLSDETPFGCSSPFSITSIEPPVIMQPFCHEEILATTPQHVIMSWTMPAGASPTTMYRIRMVEVVPDDHNINNAMQSAVPPFFFETTLSGNVFIYGAGQPALVAGKRYAFRVSAFDPLGKKVFRNNGQSEVCSFTWKAQSMMTGNLAWQNEPAELEETMFVGKAKFSIPKAVHSTTVNGKLTYIYSDPGETEQFSLANTNIKLVVAQIETGFNKPPIASNVLRYILTPDQAPETVRDNDVGKVLGTAKTDANGNFSFLFLNKLEFGKAGSTSGEHGRFYYMVALIMIESPHSSYYFHPDDLLMPESGKVNDVGTVKAKVRSYQVDVIAKPRSSYIDDLNHAVGTDKLSAINVYLCRKIDFSYQLYPMNDGKVEGAEHKVDASVRTKFPGFQVVAHGTTKNDGTISFQRVVYHHNNTYQYYLTADVDHDGDQNYSFGMPVPVSPPQSIPSSFSQVYPATEPFSKNYIYYTLARPMYLDAKFPRIAGKVNSATNSSPLQGVRVSLTEYYNYSATDQAKALYPPYKTQENTFVENCLSKPYNSSFIDNRVTFTAADGTYAFEDLTMLYSRNLQAVIGPYRKLDFQYSGYVPFSVDVGLLIHGKKDIRDKLLMHMGARLSGYVTDGESGKGLQAYVRIPGNPSTKCDINSGHFNIPVPLLPGKPQQLIVSCPGYFTDTVSFVANQKTNSHHVKLFSRERKLKVVVRVKGSPLIPVKNIWVHILNVTNNINGNNYPMGATTDDDGIALMNFKNGGLNDDLEYRVSVSNLSIPNQHYETKYYSLKIPYSKHPTLLVCDLPRATCLNGFVYAGIGEESPVDWATVRYVGADETLSASSGGAGGPGYYFINNFPVRLFRQTIAAMKSQSNYIGDEKQIRIAQASNQCMRVNFNLTVYDDMDITSLMGFPMEVLKLQADSTGARISGNLTHLPPNDQFRVNPNTYIPFKNIPIVPGASSNSAGVPIAEPASLPFATSAISNNQILVLNTFTGSIINPNGMLIDREAPGSAFGVIRGMVNIAPTEFNNNLTNPPKLWLAYDTSEGTAKMQMPLIAANPATKKPVSLPSDRFFICNDKGEAIRYSLPAFPQAAYADATKSFLQAGKVIMHTTLHTNCNNVSPANLNINMGDVEITKNGMTSQFSNTISLNLNKWPLTSNDWTITTDGLFLNEAVINAGITIPVKNIEITHDALHYDKAVADFGSINILGNIPIAINTSNQGLNYVDNGGGDMQWILYALPDGGTEVAFISNLPGLSAPGLPIESIRIVSDGSAPSLAPGPAPLKLFGLVDFFPNQGSSINIYDSPPWFRVLGALKPGIPYIEEFKGNIAWEKKPQGLEFVVNNPNPINFTHNNMNFIWDLETIRLENDLFSVGGTATEAGKLGPVRVVLQHKTATTEIDIPSDEKIFITQDKTKFFDKVVGGMEVDRPAHKWNNFWFEGEMAGMTGISDNAQKSRLKFVCEGSISASAQSINVSKLDAFPGMSFTYDFANSRLQGLLNIDKDLNGMHAVGTATAIFDPNGWYLNIGGSIDVPGIGGCGLFGLFGDYKATPPEIGNTFGALKCIPSSFQGSVSGFLLQGSLTKQLIPEIKWVVTVPVVDVSVGVHIKADLSLTARTWMSFDPNINTYGISLLAQGVIDGGLSTGLVDISTNVKAQLGIMGLYESNGNYYVAGCGSVNLGVTASAFAIPEWVSVDVASPELGVTMKIGNNVKEFKMILGSCGNDKSLCP